MQETTQTGFEELFLQEQLLHTSNAASAIEIAPDIYFIQSLGNVGFITTEEGVVVIDTGNPLDPTVVLGPLRQVTQQAIAAIVYTHGHADHAANTLPLLEEAGRRGDVRPRIIGHCNIAQRVQRYAEFYGLNDSINRLQFRITADHAGFPPAQRFVLPDQVYETHLTLRVGTFTFELHHALGETDDITWIYIPERKTIFSGDLFISSCPNIGNPLKVQRYDAEWADALERMAACHAEVVAPGHGGVVRGTASVQDALLTTAQALRFLHHEVAKRLNRGEWEEQIVAEVQLPEVLSKHWALRPIYGCPAYIVRGIYRRHRGWYDGNPSHLSPSPSSQIAHEVVALIGAKALLARAAQLVTEQNYQLALHLVDYVLDDPQGSADFLTQARRCKIEILLYLVQQETSYIGQSLLLAGIDQLYQYLPREGMPMV